MAAAGRVWGSVAVTAEHRRDRAQVRCGRAVSKTVLSETGQQGTRSALGSVARHLTDGAEDVFTGCFCPGRTRPGLDHGRPSAYGSPALTTWGSFHTRKILATARSESRPNTHGRGRRSPE